MKVAITGGTGFVGRHIARQLTDDGHEVVLIARGCDGTDPSVLKLPGARFYPIGLDDVGKLAEAFSGCGAVAHCAGINRERGAQSYRRVHVEGTRRVVAAALKAGVPKIALISFLRARPNCGSPYHESKWAAEEIVRASGLDYTIFKCGVIYGKGDHMLDHLSHALHTFPVFALVGFQDQSIRPTAVEDVARIANASLVAGALSRRTVAITGPEELTLGSAVRRVARVVGRKPLMFPLPVWFHYLLARVVERMMKVPLVSLAQVRILSEGIVEPWPPCETLPPELAPTIGFTDDQIRKGLPPAGPFGWRDVRCCDRGKGLPAGQSLASFRRNNPMKPKLSDLWRWSGTLERGPYLFWGVLLFAFKFNLDRVVGAVWFGKRWTIFDWDTLRLYLWQSPMGSGERFYLAALLATSLPFLWLGTILTLRRLRSLDWQPWWVFFFFVPVLKLLFFALLCVLPSRAAREQPPRVSEGGSRTLSSFIPRSGLGSALLAIVLTAVLATAAAWLGTAVFQDYGWTIFVGVPFAMGFLSVLIYGFHEPRGIGKCLGVACVTVLLCGAGLLLFAFEGAICLVMAAPLAIGIAAIGGVAGYAVQKTFRWHDEAPRVFGLVILAMPAMMSLEHAAPPALPLLVVKSSVVVDAPPEKVWRNVVAFAQLPPPHETIFKLGVAYPIRAEIYGHGVGAVRHCNFSTGPFVEPIEVWEEPRLLKFSVTQNPEPMQEWTPYRHVHPAHLDGYLESRAGQFRLVPLPGGRTLLEGTTWYSHRLWPAAYWQVWSDHIIRTIHLRVLNHVKELSERKDP